MHATFLNLVLEIKDGKIISKFFDKRDEFSCFIVKIANCHSNVPSSVFYRTFSSEILRTARIEFTDFVLKPSQKSMENQGGNKARLLGQLLKANENHQNVFKKCNAICK